MTPVYDPDAGQRLMPETEVEKLAPHVIALANLQLRGEITAAHWEECLEGVLKGGKNA